MEWIIKINDNKYNFIKYFNSILKRRDLYNQINKKGLEIRCGRVINNLECNAKLILNYNPSVRIQYFLTTKFDSKHQEWCINNIKEEINLKWIREIISSDLIKNFYDDNLVQIITLNNGVIKNNVLNYKNSNLEEFKKLINSKDTKSITIETVRNYIFDTVRKDSVKKGYSAFDEDFKNHHFETFNDGKKYIDINIKTEHFINAILKFTLNDFTNTNYEIIQSDGTLLIEIPNIDVFHLEKADTSTNLKIKKVKDLTIKKKLQFIFKNKNIINNIIKLKKIANNQYSESKVDIKTVYGLSFIVDKNRHIFQNKDELIIKMDVLEFEEFICVKKNYKFYELDEFVENKLNQG
ncbi:hypothetical protein SGLAD_v1c04660 [Spiroplasma gladiatoris]|uniref:Uncharacterized protein n=2 Tax=Spiroplasma gladiatoris TaxID=2143 RepID=A0A4P7AGX7_9MOLU|nr:hypothetical protein SGLAD_v1c04660 [Spiroplasma gladiatoris]